MTESFKQMMQSNHKALSPFMNIDMVNTIVTELFVQLKRYVKLIYSNAFSWSSPSYFYYIKHAFLSIPH